MRKIIHHIRRQPEAVRRSILHVSVIFCGIVLMLLWAYSLGTNLSKTDMRTELNQDLKPLSALKDNMVGGYNSLSGSAVQAE